MTLKSYRQMEWRNDGVARAEWPRGQWDDEPDKIQWVDEVTGLDCLMHRNGLGAWCGYVGVPEGHPAFEKHYDAVGADVHGGLTYSDFCQVAPDGEEHPERGICHVPLEGRPHRVWWIGFDCNHGRDSAPGLLYGGLGGGTYKPRAYVETECTRLAAQLAETGKVR